MATNYGTWKGQPAQPSRLYRALQPTDSLFTVGIGRSTWLRNFRDGIVESITINRGTSSADPSLNVPTMEVNLAHDLGILYQQPITLDLHPPAILSEASNYRPSINRRYTGYVGLQEREMRRTDSIRETATSRVYGVGAIQALLNSSRRVEMNTTSSLYALWQKIAAEATLNTDAIWYAWSIGGTILFPSDDEQRPKLSEALGYLSDADVQVTETRAGELHAKSIMKRLNEADGESWRVYPTAEIWQVIAPLSQSQRTPVAPEATIFTTRLYNPDTGEFPEWELDMPWPSYTRYGIAWPASRSREDWTFYGWREDADSSHMVRAFRARLARQVGLEWSVPEISFDLLALLSPRQNADTRRANARLVCDLLSLEEGSPLILGSSFGKHTGVHFATGMSETITAESWELTLSLAPREHVTGELSEIQTWDDAPYPWTTTKMKTWSN